jgi:Tol biopolymer transport system component
MGVWIMTRLTNITIIKWTCSAALATVLVVSVTAAAQKTPEAETLMQTAHKKEVVDGDHAGAIQTYKSAFAEAKAKGNHAIAAMALLGMADIYRSLGDDQSRKLYEQVLREYPEQKEAVSLAKAALGEPKQIVKRLVCVDCADFRDELSSDGKSILGAGPKGDLAFWDLSDSSKVPRKRLMVEPAEGFFMAERPVLSPDGRQIAYVLLSGDITRGQLRVVANAVGAKPRVLAGEPEFRYFRTGGWSKDGKSVLVFAEKSDTTWQIAWVSVANGAVTPVVSLGWRMRFPGRGPVLSPDGRYIAYAALPVNPPNQEAGQREAPEEFGIHIYVVASDGSTGTEPVKTAGINDQPAWSADGKHLLFTSNRSGRLDLWAVAMREGQATNSPILVRSDIGNRVNLVGVRSGSYYYTDSISTNFISFADLNPRQPAPKESFVGLKPAWSPDGKSLAFKRPHPGGGRDDFDVVVHSIESGDEKIYSSKIGLSSGSGPVWSHDGTSLLVDVHKFGSDRNAPGMLYRVDVKTGAYREIPNTDTRGPWALSSDDKTVYFARPARGGDPDGIYAVDMVGGSARFVLAPVKEEPGGFVLSPDGHTFLRKQFRGFELVNVDGTDSREVRLPTAAFFGPGPIWTPDGRAILYGAVESGSTRIMRMPAEGGEPAFTGVELPGIVLDLSLNRDGSRMAVGIRKAADELWALDNIASALR